MTRGFFLLGAAAVVLAFAPLFGFVVTDDEDDDVLDISVKELPSDAVVDPSPSGSRPLARFLLLGAGFLLEVAAGFFFFGNVDDDPFVGAVVPPRFFEHASTCSRTLFS